MGVFDEKLATLHLTMKTSGAFDIAPVAAALRGSKQKLVYAVGSGGSVAVAEFFRTCRMTLHFGPTLVQTPMEIVVETENLSEAEVWLFTARGENPDILAAFKAALGRGAGQVRIVTTNSKSPLVEVSAVISNCKSFVLPVSSEKDGFLATHSVATSIMALCRAADTIIEEPLGLALVEALVRETERITAEEHTQALAQQFSSVSKSDTVFVLHDPRLASAAVAIETSLWEAAICSVQRTDIRNFAHGRHVWLAHRPAETVLISLLANDTAQAWGAIDKHLPPDIRRHSFQLGNAGRYDNAVGILEALSVVGALGRAVSVDPGKPGVGSFARSIYNSTELVDLVASRSPSVTHKLSAVRRISSPASASFEVCKEWLSFKQELEATEFNGLVLDYDGTIVPTDRRLEPPATEIVAELARLLEAGLSLGIATGRGGSAGEKLREALPSALHDRVIMGYYNGSCVRPLSIDLRDCPADRDPEIEELFSWIAAMPEQVIPSGVRNSGVQLSISIEHVVDRSSFEPLLKKRLANTNGYLRMATSGHSIDVVLASANKLAVLSAVRTRIGLPSAFLLCVGDRGGEGGNDFYMLAERFGVSVGEVSGGSRGCWSLWGRNHGGAIGLLRILSSLHPVAPGIVKLDMAQLFSPSHEG